MEEFEDLFLQWLDEASNRESLEIGGLGELATLAPRVANWAEGVLSTSED